MAIMMGDGGWVDESSRCEPKSRTGALRLQAELDWLTLSKKQQLPLHIFRIAGIYGPQRNALRRIAAGKPYSVYKEGHVFSRIYINDLVEILNASLRFPHPFSIYNVADDEPASSYIVDAYAAHLLNKNPPPLVPFINAPLSAMEKDFYTDNRRVANSKIKRELGVILKYPSFREGLNKILEKENLLGNKNCF